nr:GNAT family N-acetyltransferase [Nocardioides daedukensis]
MRPDLRPDLRNGHLRIDRVPFTHPDAVRLIEEVQQEYTRLYGTPDDTPLDQTMFDAPMGAFFVGYVDGEPAASGAWRRREDVSAFETTNTAEIKRMYVAARARRTGLARAMLAHLERTASEAGAEVSILETGIKQPEAIALYESSGYQRIAGFGHYRDSPLSRCFGKRL